jgi:hypothetical protein
MIHPIIIEIKIDDTAYCVKASRNVDTGEISIRKKAMAFRYSNYTTSNGNKMRRKLRVWPKKQPDLYNQIIKAFQAKAAA